jgi:hypothetical protein
MLNFAIVTGPTRPDRNNEAVASRRGGRGGRVLTNCTRPRQGTPTSFTSLCQSDLPLLNQGVVRIQLIGTALASKHGEQPIHTAPTRGAQD